MPDDAIEVGEADAEQAPLPKPAPHKPRSKQPAPPDEPPSEVRLAQADDQSIYEWLKGLSGEATVRVNVYRETPRMWTQGGRQYQVGGSLGWYNEMLTEDDIRERFGGGKFKIKAFKVNAKNQQVFGGQRTIEIAGSPKITGEMYDVVDSSNPPTVSMQSMSGEDPGLARQALNLTAQTASAERERAERLQERLAEAMGKSGLDPALMSALIDPLRDQTQSLQAELRESRREAAAREERMLERTKQEPDGGVVGKLLLKMTDGESARIDALRNQYESELRQARERTNDEVKRAEDRLERIMLAAEESHKREIAHLRSSFDSEAKTREVAYQTQITVVAGQLEQARSDLAALKIEAAELRARKDVPIEEQVGKLIAMRDLFKNLGGEDEGGEDKPVWQQVIEGVVNSDVAKAVAAKVAGQQAAQPTQMQQIQDEQQRRRRLALAAARQQRAQQAAPPQPPPSPPADGQPAPPQPQIMVDAATAQGAVAFIEQALKNNADPKDFAQTIRSMVPGSIIESIKVDGIESFMQRFGGAVTEGSVLNTQVGLNFLRRVAKFLNGATTAE